MTTLVRKVATAIADYYCDGLMVQDYDEVARVAIQAMTEPTDRMKVAGGLKCEAMMFQNDPEYSGVIFNDMGVVFRTMIAAAVEERS